MLREHIGTVMNCRKDCATFNAKSHLSTYLHLGKVSRFRIFHVQFRTVTTKYIQQDSLQSYLFYPSYLRGPLMV
jgi:deoxyribodipyrimidine photolyase